MQSEFASLSDFCVEVILTKIAIDPHLSPLFVIWFQINKNNIINYY